jgi:hypothetical protein
MDKRPGSDDGTSAGACFRGKHRIRVATIQCKARMFCSNPQVTIMGRSAAARTFPRQAVMGLRTSPSVRFGDATRCQRQPVRGTVITLRRRKLQLNDQSLRSLYLMGYSQIRKFCQIVSVWMDQIIFHLSLSNNL